MVEGLTGSLAQLSPADILRMLSAGRQSGCLELMEGNLQGEIYLQAGVVVHAEAGSSKGESALAVLVGWRRGTFRFDSQVRTTEATITKPLEPLLAECLRIATEREAIARAIPSVDSVPRLAQVIPGGPITLQPHEWLVITYVNGERSIADIAAALGRDDFTIGKVLFRLVNAKLVSVQHEAPVQQVARAVAGPAFFRVLTQAVAAAMGPLASIIVDDAIEDLGSSRDAFPRDLTSSLVERIAGEIRDIDKRVQFQQTMLASMRQLAA